MSLGLLTGIKAWFAAASVGAKVGAITAGVVVAAGAVATPIVIIGSQSNNNDKNTDNSNGSSANLNGGQELSAEQQAYCESMLEYMTNNNGKVPEGENREEITKKCYGESNENSSKFSTTTYISLEEASKAKWEAEHCEFVRHSETTFDVVCDTQRPWEVPSNLTTLHELQLQYCSDWNNDYTQTVGMADCAAHGASWVDELVYELSDKSNWTEDTQIIGIDPYALLEPIPNTEHGYKFYEGESNPAFPSELLRTDCEKENDTSWTCPTVELKDSSIKP